jgi:hypothetical protein
MVTSEATPFRKATSHDDKGFEEVKALLGETTKPSSYKLLLIIYRGKERGI